MAELGLSAADLSLPELAEYARRLWSTLPAGAVLWLSGAVGAGKTTFAQALVRAAGGTEPARSPTFALLHHYATPDGVICHADCYRLKHPAESADLDLDAEARASRLLLIEWPERAGPGVPPPDAHLRFDHVTDPSRRRVERVR